MQAIQNGFAQYLKQAFTKDLKFLDGIKKIPCLRILGNKNDNKNISQYSSDKETLLKIFKHMVTLREADTRFNLAQREGKISFYLTSRGEEASIIASAAALENDDIIFPQYREAGVLLYRGFTIQQMAHQLYGNNYDLGKGRQMPIHLGSNNHNYFTVSSTVGTQIPNAAGAGYHLRASDQNKIAITYFSDGGTSTGDFHAGIRFAAALKSQTLFFCRNNMYAISTPIYDQYKGEIAALSIASGVSTIRIDGNDALAVYESVKAARNLIVTQKRPVLIEAMTYRQGDHSTSDSSKLYRTSEELKQWNEYITDFGDPIDRLYQYILSNKWITAEEYKEISIKAKSSVREALKAGESIRKPPVKDLFTDVYSEMTPNLESQYQELKNHLSIYSKEYEIDKFERI